MRRRSGCAYRVQPAAGGSAPEGWCPGRCGTDSTRSLRSRRQLRLRPPRRAWAAGSGVLHGRNPYPTADQGNLVPAHLGLGTLAAVGGTSVLGYIADAPLRSAKINDFYIEAWHPYVALFHGHLLTFLHTGPVYLGSLLLRAPFTFVPTLWGAGPRELYFASAVPCILALAVFCTWLAAQPRRAGAVTWGTRISPIVCCIASPVVLINLYDGHPEEILGSVLVIGAVVAAARGRRAWASVLIGVAVVNKPWALLAVPVVLVTMPGVDRRLLTGAGALTSLAVIGLIAFPPSALAIGKIFNPPQLLWWFGSHSWLAQQSRPMIVAVTVACAGVWWARQQPVGRSIDGVPDALLLLALVMLLRAAFDPWNNLYYHLPFLFALMAYEVRSGRMPLFTSVYTFVLLAVVPVRGVPHMGVDLRAAVYAGIIVPVVAWLGLRAFAPEGKWRAVTRIAARRLPGRNGPAAVVAKS
jgi:hypothetical protein